MHKPAQAISSSFLRTLVLSFALVGLIGGSIAHASGACQDLFSGRLRLTAAETSRFVFGLGVALNERADSSQSHFVVRDGKLLWGQGEPLATLPLRFDRLSPVERDQLRDAKLIAVVGRPSESDYARAMSREIGGAGLFSRRLNSQTLAASYMALFRTQQGALAVGEVRLNGTLQASVPAAAPKDGTPQLHFFKVPDASLVRLRTFRSVNPETFSVSRDTLFVQGELVPDGDAVRPFDKGVVYYGVSEATDTAMGLGLSRKPLFWIQHEPGTNLTGRLFNDPRYSDSLVPAFVIVHAKLGMGETTHYLLTAAEVVAAGFDPGRVSMTPLWAWVAPSEGRFGTRAGGRPQFFSPPFWLQYMTQGEVVDATYLNSGVPIARADGNVAYAVLSAQTIPAGSAAQRDADYDGGFDNRRFTLTYSATTVLRPEPAWMKTWRAEADGRVKIDQAAKAARAAELLRDQRFAARLAAIDAKARIRREQSDTYWQTFEADRLRAERSRRAAARSVQPRSQPSVRNPLPAAAKPLREAAVQKSGRVATVLTDAELRTVWFDGSQWLVGSAGGYGSMAEAMAAAAPLVSVGKDGNIWYDAGGGAKTTDPYRAAESRRIHGANRK